MLKKSLGADHYYNYCFKKTFLFLLAKIFPLLLDFTPQIFLSCLCAVSLGSFSIHTFLYNVIFYPIFGIQIFSMYVITQNANRRQKALC